MSAAMPIDVAIIGGGIIGSACAYFLLRESPTLTVRVIEPDPSYKLASALRASGGCRVQFTCPENIQMSRYSIDFIRQFEATMGTQAQPAPVDWVEGGYLFIVPPAAVAALERNVRRQQAEGCVVDLLTPSELKQRFPSMNVGDLGAGAHTPHDGWCDPHGLLWGFRRKAVELGARYIQASFESAGTAPDRVVSTALSNGETLRGLACSGPSLCGIQSGELQRTWSGLYEVNELGGWKKRLADLFTVAGFPGHGMMHAPAAAWVWLN